MAARCRSHRSPAARLIVDLSLAQRAALLVTASLAWVLSRPSRSPQHRPVAVLFVAWFLADLARWAIVALIADAPTPYHGLARVLFHVDQALLLLWPFGAAALVLIVLAQRAPQIAMGAWAGALLVLVSGYPELRGRIALGRVFTSVHVVEIVVELASVAVFLRRRQWPGSTQEIALLLVASDLGLALGPYLFADPLRDWFTSRWPTIFVYAAISVVQTRRILWTQRVFSSSATRPRASFSR